MSNISAPSARALDLIHQKLSNLRQAKAELQATNEAQANQINSMQQDMTQSRQHHEETQQHSSMKIEKLDKELNIVNGMRRKAEEAIAKAQRMNSVYDFVSLVERMLCFRLDIKTSTLAQALRSEPTNWARIQTLLKIQDIYPGSLLGTVHRIKSQRLQYGHSLPQTAQRFILSTSLLQIARGEFYTGPLGTLAYLTSS
ncbi:hypothetical protein PSTG_07509 [Puccinia striiformis f. sp. tritici PST-78]|uniref:Uncharacterized protein n=1 Tax=Puccinia striiformis f. sp. tritici PST-78 TaxID=1165861 RepID=A0A0L0VIT6_9BASI|nr:hypothetical protein PSTG_07509 [Puccinia striiformis f. sp. tritici PST-78]